MISQSPRNSETQNFILGQCPKGIPNKTSHPHLKDWYNSPSMAAASRARRPLALAAACLSWRPENRESTVGFLELENEGCPFQGNRSWKWSHLGVILKTPGGLVENRFLSSPQGSQCGRSESGLGVCVFISTMENSVALVLRLFWETWPRMSSEVHRNLGRSGQQVWQHHI